jgi:hypothetical protein
MLHAWEKLLELLYKSALEYESIWELTAKQSTDVQHLAMQHVFAEKMRSRITEYFDLLIELPYDCTCNLEALLCFLASQQIPNSWKAAQLKMGLLLANEIGRLAWYILHSSILFTFELLVKFKKGRTHDGHRACNLFYVDLPSASSAA